MWYLTGFIPLHDACLTGILDYVRVLVDAKSNVNTQNMNGITPLMDACYAGDAEIIEFLLDRGSWLQFYYVLSEVWGSTHNNNINPKQILIF